MPAPWKAAVPAALLLSLCATRALAQQAPRAPGADEPEHEHVWSHGISEEDRNAADALFAEGNSLLKESICISAAAKYREALKHWDHPNIHYNLALALMNLDQPIETHEHLVAAMKYGPEPLEKERFEHAKNYLLLLEKQLARVRIRCAVPGAKVEMNGQSLFEPPGQYEGLVRGGRHTVVASKEGYVTNHSVRAFEGGQTVEIDLELKTMAQLTRHRRRWPVWIPWSVAGLGAALAATGGVVQYDAAQKIDWVNEQSRIRCTTGCDAEPDDLARERDDAKSTQKVAMAAYGAGGAALALGAVLVFFNRGETIVDSYDSGTPAQPPRKASIDVAPVVDPDRPGIVATLRF